MKTAKFACLLLGIAGLIAGCKKKEIGKDQLVGSWKIDLQDSVGLEHYSRESRDDSVRTRLDLNADGTFFVTSLPRQYLRLNLGDKPMPHSASGTWRISHDVGDGGGGRLEFVFTTVDNYKGDELPFEDDSFFMDAWRSKVHLFYFVGDPDEDQRVIFDRITADR